MADKDKSFEFKAIPSGWNVTTIEETCEILDTKRKPLNSNQRSVIRGAIPYFGANGVVDYISEWIFDEPLVLVAEDGGYFDEFATRPIAYRISGKSWVNNHAHVLRPKAIADIGWIHYSLQHRDIRPFINSGTRSKLNQADLKRIPIPLPPLPEQRKIAAILSSVDDAIEKSSAVIDQLEVVKKALMQELLTRGLPGRHTRFKQTEIGEIPSEWKLEPLGSVLQVKGGFAFRSSDFSDSGVPVVRMSNLKRGNLDFIDCVMFPNRIDKSVEGFLLKQGDVLLGLSGSIGPTGSLGNFAQVYEKDLPCLLNQRVARLEIRNNALANEFLLCVVASEKFRSSIEQLSTSLAQANVSPKQIESLLWPIPLLKEQIEIGNTIQSVSNQIRHEKDTRSAAAELKRSLLSTLLSGEIRVPLEKDAA